MGAQYILLPQFDVEAVIEYVQREGVTHMMMVPSQIIALLHSPNFNADTMRSVQMICSVWCAIPSSAQSTEPPFAGGVL